MGDIQKAFGPTTGAPAFGDVTSVTGGLTEFNDVYKVTYAGKTEPTTMTAYITLLTNHKSFSTNDFATTTTLGYTQALSDINALVTCTSDKWVMNDSDCSVSPAASPIWNTGDATTYNNGSGVSLCINVGTWLDNGNSATTRYTGSCADANKATVDTKLTTVGTSRTAFRAQVDNMIGTSGATGLNSAAQINTVAKLVLSKISASTADLNALSTKMTDVLQFAQSFVEKTDGMVDCRILRRELVLFSNTFCHSFVLDWNKFAEIFVMVGPLIFFFSICMCSAIRCPPIYKPNDESGGQVGPDATVAGKQLDYMPAQQGDGNYYGDNNGYEMTGLQGGKANNIDI